MSRTDTDHTDIIDHAEAERWDWAGMYMLGNLSPDNVEIFLAHMSLCPACQNRVAKLRSSENLSLLRFLQD